MVKVSIIKLLYTIALLNIIIFGFLFLYHYFSSITNNFEDTVDLFFNNIRFLSHLQTIFIPLLLYFFIIIKNKSSKVVILLILVINFYILFYLGSRGSIYTIAISSVIIYFTSTAKIKKQLILLLFIAIFSFILYYLANNFFIESAQFKSLSHLQTFNSSGRGFIFSTIISLIFDTKHIFSAVGFSSQSIGVTGSLHPHNLFLYIFLGFGTLGFIIVSTIFIRYCILLWNIYRDKQTTKHTYLMFSFLSILTHSMVSGLYIMPLTSILLIYIFIVINRTYFVNIPKQNQHISWLGSKIIYTILLLISLSNIYYLQQNTKLVKEYFYIKEQLQNKKLPKSNVSGIMLISRQIYN
ncbi:MAG: oligosaccharide repeat unit polymerase [Arcobacteraceae bacterium]|nr:oligosaccharide repeat unit polymerase [Arcobacteraceae bacterium]